MTTAAAGILLQHSHQLVYMFEIPAPSVHERALSLPPFQLMFRNDTSLGLGLGCCVVARFSLAAIHRCLMRPSPHVSMN